jgi:hypothetical protein
MVPDIYEYAIMCPECKAKTVMVIADTGLTLFTCNSCENNVMLYNSKLYKIRKNFLKNILDNYRTENCGNIIFTRKANNSSDFITEDKIRDLKKELDKTIYIEDFLKNL